jgi:hypothetical protein
MIKKKNPLIRIDFKEYIYIAIHKIIVVALVLWIFALIVAAIKATHLVEG